MGKNIVLISLLDISKALVIAVSKFQVVCFSLSESRLIFCRFSVTQCHPLIFPAALCPLSCSMLCCILTLSSYILLYITDIISLYFVNYLPWFIFLPFLFCSRFPNLLWSGPSLLTFASCSADLQQIYLTQCLFPFLISSNSSFFPCSFFLTTLSSCFSTPFPLWPQPAHNLGVPDLGWDHQNHQPKVPQRFLGTFGSCQAGKPWPREGAGGWGCWVALTRLRAHAPDLCSRSPHLSLLVLPSSLDNYHPCHLPFLITPWMLKLSLHHSDLSLISSIRFYFPFCRYCGYCCPLLPFTFLLFSSNGSPFLFVHTFWQKIRMSFFFPPFLFFNLQEKLIPTPYLTSYI